MLDRIRTLPSSGTFFRPMTAATMFGARSICLRLPDRKLRGLVARAALAAGMLAQSAIAAAAPPPPLTAEEAATAEQTSLRNALHPVCVGGGDEIVVCGHRDRDRDRLPLRTTHLSSLPGEAPSTIAAMRVYDTPLPPPQEPAPKENQKKHAMFDFMKVAAMALSVGERLVDRDRTLPPIPTESPPD